MMDGAPWDYGTELGYLQELCTYWRDRFDWRAQENLLNQFPQFTTEVSGLRLRFIHARSPHPNAFPLIITHGWPGSVYEFIKIIDPLTTPEKFGGRPEITRIEIGPAEDDLDYRNLVSQLLSMWNYQQLMINRVDS